MLRTNSGAGGSEVSAGDEENLHAELLDAAKGEAAPPSSSFDARRHFSSSILVIRASLRFALNAKQKSSSAPTYAAVSQAHTDDDGGTARSVSPSSDSVIITILSGGNEETTLPPAEVVAVAAEGVSRTSSRPQDQVNSPENRTNSDNRDRRTLFKRIVREKDFNSLSGLGGAESVASAFNSNKETGLQLANSVPIPLGSSMAANESRLGSAKLLVRYLIDAAKSWTIFLLLIAAASSMATGLVETGPNYGWHDGIVILAAVLLLVTVPSLVRFRRAKKLEKKMQIQEKKVEVIRGGQTQEIGASGVVEGDLVILKEGDRIPGDGLLVGGDGWLILDEEAAPRIHSAHNPFVCSGSKVITGNGRMIVTSAGTDTAIGKRMSMVKVDPNEPTWLQSWIHGPMSYTDKVSLCIAILIILVMFARFLCRNHDKALPELKGKPPLEKLMSKFMRILFRPRGLVLISTTTLTAMVMVFQHGVSLAITLSLSYWNQKVTSCHDDHANPQNLSACATMGFATVICFDISGGIMLNLMEIGKFFVGDEEISHGEESNTSNDVIEVLRRGIDVSIIEPKDPRSPIDSLVYSWLQPSRDVDVESRSESFSVDKFRKTNSGKGILLIKHGELENMHLHWRGPAQRILTRCSHYYDREGTIHALENQRGRFEDIIGSMAHDGLHTIAFACKQTAEQELRQDGLTLLAVVGLKFREEGRSAIEALRKNGVSIKMTSEDELDEVKPIFAQLGALRPGSDCDMLEGITFREFSDNVRREKISEISIMEKSHPEDKLLIVQYLKLEGHAVAFFGGQNSGNGPALREAHVGLVEEARSTEFAREASDIVITRGGGFSSLCLLLVHCRCVSHNIQKFTELQLTACVSGLIITAISSMAIGESTITTIQLIWGNLVVSFLGGMMMIMELPCREIKAGVQPLASRTNPLTRGIWRNLVVQVLYQACVLLLFLFEGQAIHGISQDVKSTIVFNSYILCQVVNLFNVIEVEKKEVFLITLKCYQFLLSVGAVLVLQVLLVQFMKSLANYAKLNLIQWAFCFISAALPWGFRSTLKFISNHVEWFTLSTNLPMGVGFLPSPHFAYTGLMFSMFLIFSFTYFKTASSQMLL